MAASNTTTNFGLNLTTLDKIPWNEEMHNNFHILDAVLARYISINSVQGAWENALAVTAGQRYIDTDLDTIWEVLVVHTTPSTGTFAASRTAVPANWQAITTDAQAATYAQNTAYSVNTFLADGGRYGVALTTFTSDNTSPNTTALSYDADVTAGNISTLIDVTSLVADILPTSDSTYSIGSTALRWLKGWFDSLTVTGDVGAATGTFTGEVTATGFTGTLDGILGSGSASAATVTALEVTSLSGTGAVTITDILDEDNMASNSATKLSTQQSIKAYVDAQVDTVDTLAEVLAIGNTSAGTDLAISAGDDITFTDSSKAIFGTGGDLEIYHNGSNTYINETGTGKLIILATDLTMADTGNAHNYLNAVSGAGVTLYYDNNSRIATSATGVAITGVATATGFVGTLTGNVTGNTSGTAATVTGAAQTAITSVGTLTALQVDNININGNAITSTAGTDLTITPVAGQQIVLDGTIVIDAGVVTGATSITSTAFVGDITGDVTGTADVATVATTVTITDNESTNESNALIFTAGGDVDGGNLGLESDGTLTYNPSTGKVTATGFTGTLDGILGGGTPAAATVTTVVASGVVSVDDTTDSTSATTGSVHTDGGLGVAKVAFFGGTSIHKGSNTEGVYLYGASGSSTNHAHQFYNNVSGLFTHSAVSGGGSTKQEFIVSNSGTPLTSLTLESAGDITVEAGNLVINTAGKGIDFSAQTPAAGMTAELLDHYEEGDLTIGLTAGASDGVFSSAVGSYTRIGRQVFVTGQLTATSIGTMSGALKVTGMPYPITNANNNKGGGSVGRGTSLNLGTAGRSITLGSALNTSTLYLNVWDHVAGVTGLTAAEFGATGNIEFSFSYYV